jgi:integrase/recombinase XerD
MGTRSRLARGGHASTAAVVRIWRDHQVKDSTIAVYLHWVERFDRECRSRGVSLESQLTADRVAEFARRYAGRRGIEPHGAHAGARSALFAWVCALSALGHELPPWATPAAPDRAYPPLIQEFLDFQVRHRGIAPASSEKQAKHLLAFLGWLRVRRRPLARVELRDVDAFVVRLRQRYARTTVADFCSTLRAFLGFLYRTGRLPSDLACSVAAPIVRRGERPPRALPWQAVQRILAAIDRSTPVGCRDYTLLLLMAVYGMGAAEVIGLRLDDLEWTKERLRVRRPKTRVETLLPLLPAVARALATYLQRGRPRHTPARHLFVQMRAPHGELSSAAVRHLLKTRAHAAGIAGRFLGGHALRHSHAGRQMDLGAPPKVVSDILGHRRPESTSAYVRIATDRLRAVALRVPR